MVDWESVLNTEDEDELKAVKLWLFQENVRLERERARLEEKRTQLDRQSAELEETKEHFLSDRVKFRDEMEELNRRTLQERKRLREENLFFDKKMAILQDGFRALEEDRQKLKREKLEWEKEKDILREKRISSRREDELLLEDSNVAEILFRKAENPLTLRKRYRDLVKIFHPDNVAGDEQLVQLINREFNRRRAAF